MKRILLILVFLTFEISLFAQSSSTVPHLVNQNGRHALMVDGKPYFMFGGQSGNSSTWPSLMPGVGWLQKSLTLIH